MDRWRRERTGDERAREGPVLSVVVPAFNEEANIGPLAGELQTVLDGTDLSWEVILVDDGSRDETWERIQAAHGRDPRVGGLRLSRNFGHQYALFAGLTRARGAAVVSMDADLQHPPELIPKLIEEWKKGIPIVQTIRHDSGAEGFFKRLTSRLFYKVFSFLSGTRLESGTSDFRLLDRMVVDDLLGFGEEGLFLRGLVHWMGVETSRVEFECRPRSAGDTNYSLLKMVKLAWTGVTSFSLVPLRLSILVGLLTSAFAFEQLAEAIYRNVFQHATVPGWTQTMVVLTFLFGMLFILLGVVGEYIGRILVEVRRRPRFVVRDELEPPRCSSRTEGSKRSPPG